MKIMISDVLSGNERFFGEANTIQDAVKTIGGYIDMTGFKSYYCRWWEKDSVLYCDYGSHAQLFKIYTKG